jgi:hypothetical protein
VGRRVGIALVFVGLFLLFFAPFVRWYAYPRLQKAPLDEYFQPVATGTGSYFNVAQLKVLTGANLKNTRTVRGDVKAGSSKTAVWDYFDNTIDTADGGVITAKQERIALDRDSAQVVHCCGENPSTLEGLTLKFPFNTARKSYVFWDDIPEKAFPIDYSGEETVAGVHTYRFVQNISNVHLQTIQISGAQAGEPSQVTVPADEVYNDVTTVWVEPRSGVIVKGSQAIHEVLQKQDGTAVFDLFNGTLIWNDATVKAAAHTASTARSQLLMLSTTLPIAAAVLGLILIGSGLLLSRTSAQGRHEAVTPQTVQAT